MIPSGVDVWVFDLDNTLYPASNLYDEIGERMSAYIARALGVDPEEATRLREKYLHEYGATIVGLVRHHGMNARDFLSQVHDADHSVLAVDDELTALIASLPGRRIVFTNGGGGHGQRVIESLGMAHCFEAVFDIENAGLAPKPQPESYQRLIEAHAIDPKRALFIEDTLRNLEPAHALGFKTALVGAVHPAPLAAYVDHHAPDLRTLLRAWLA